MTAARRLRLLTEGKNGSGVSKEDMQAYYTCEEWAQKRREARDAWRELLGYDGCILCGSPAGLQIHHIPDGYRHLFREDPIKHLRVICARDHRNHERGR